MLRLAAPRRLPARAEAFWTLGTFLALTAIFVLYVEVRHPEWYDREYQVRQQLLHDRVAEAPERPRVYVVGSSRFVVGFIPERVGPLRDGQGRETLVFNYSHFGAGPRMNLVQLHRAKIDGVLPDYLVLELVPGFVRHDDLPVKEIAVRDVPLLWTHSNKVRLIASTFGLRLNGIYRPRTAFLRSFFPEWETQADNEKDPSLGPLGGDEHWARLDEPTDYEKKMLTSLAVGRFMRRMETFRLDPYLVSATCDLLQFCKDHGIKVAIVLTPENKQFQSWYAPGAEAEIQELLGELRTEYGVLVFDSRSWFGDELFSDPHHLRTKGAEQYTDRIEREVLPALLKGD